MIIKKTNNKDSGTAAEEHSIKFPNNNKKYIKPEEYSQKDTNPIYYYADDERKTSKVRRPFADNNSRIMTTRFNLEKTKMILLSVMILLNQIFLPVVTADRFNLNHMNDVMNNLNKAKSRAMNYFQNDQPQSQTETDIFQKSDQEHQHSSPSIKSLSDSCQSQRYKNLRSISKPDIIKITKQAEKIFLARCVKITISYRNGTQLIIDQNSQSKKLFEVYPEKQSNIASISTRLNVYRTFKNSYNRRRISYARGRAFQNKLDNRILEISSNPDPNNSFDLCYNFISFGESSIFFTITDDNYKTGLKSIYYPLRVNHKLFKLINHVIETEPILESMYEKKEIKFSKGKSGVESIRKIFYRDPQDLKTPCSSIGGCTFGGKCRVSKETDLPFCDCSELENEQNCKSNFPKKPICGGTGTVNPIKYQEFYNTCHARAVQCQIQKKIFIKNRGVCTNKKAQKPDNYQQIRIKTCTELVELRRTQGRCYQNGKPVEVCSNRLQTFEGLCDMLLDACINDYKGVRILHKGACDGFEKTFRKYRNKIHKSVKCAGGSLNAGSKKTIKEKPNLPAKISVAEGRTIEDNVMKLNEIKKVVKSGQQRCKFLASFDQKGRDCQCKMRCSDKGKGEKSVFCGSDGQTYFSVVGVIVVNLLSSDSIFLNNL